MIEVLEMRTAEIDELLKRVTYGHLACSSNDEPYVVPIYFSYDGEQIFIYTTAGKKSEIIMVNPKVCLQVEEILANGGWRSVIITGNARQVSDPVERENVIALIRETNPELLPALAIKWANDWMRKNVEVVYAIKILTVSGRFTSDIKIAAASVRPNFCS